MSVWLWLNGQTVESVQAELLMRVHHRSLVSFTGYCNDGNSMALISEYMANGNLKDYVSGMRIQSYH